MNDIDKDIAEAFDQTLLTPEYQEKITVIAILVALLDKKILSEKEFKKYQKIGRGIITTKWANDLTDPEVRKTAEGIVFINKLFSGNLGGKKSGLS